MKRLLRPVLVLFACFLPVAASRGNEREVILTLNNGRQVRTQMREIGIKGATYLEGGQKVFVPRAEIKLFTFPVAEPSASLPPAPRGEPARATPAAPAPAKAVEVGDADLAKLMASPVSDKNLPDLLKRADVRKMFATLQDQMMGSHADDPNAGAARKKASELYEQIADGKMNIAGLTALGKSTVKETDGFAGERKEAPQFEPLISQLTQLLGGP